MGQALNFNTLALAELHTEPSPWASYKNVFKQPIESAQFPDTDFTCHSQQRILEAIGRKKTAAWFQHNVDTRPLLELGETEPYKQDDLDSYWLKVAEDFLSPEYRECLSEVAKHDVRKLKMNAHFWRFGEGSFFQPHVDKPHKIVTHLMYLTENWTAEMGGCFHVLNSSDASDIHIEIPPVKNTGVIIKRTENAWHSVSPIPIGSNATRRVLQVWFWES